MRCRTSAIRILGAVIAVAALTGCTNELAAAPQSAQPAESGAPQTSEQGSATPSQDGQPAPGDNAAQGDKPNMIFVLTDDMSSDLVRYMPEVQRMQQQGARLSNYSVSDTLCCPSRASILTGQFPHNTGIFTNMGKDGGFGKFTSKGEDKSTIGTQLQRGGYQTAFMGKYMNGYEPQSKVGDRTNYVPPGWNNWAVAGKGYGQFDYQLNENGKLVDYGRAPQDYLTDVMSRKGAEFIRTNAEQDKPFYLQLNTFSPHGPATPAPRHEKEFPDVKAPRGPAFNEDDVSDKPSWLRDQKELKDKQQQRIDTLYGKRVRSLQSIDEMLVNLRTTLQETGQADNTYVVFSSDNGFHMGEHRLMPGKQTAFDTDVIVPMTVTGPDVQAGQTIEEPVQNVDLRPTFADIGGVDNPSDVDGTSMLPLLHGENPEWRTVSLVEHHGPNKAKADPDRQRKKNGNPPTYTAIRTPSGTYVEYQNGEREYYDRVKDPNQLSNTFRQLPAEQQDSLRATVRKLRECAGSNACVTAAEPS